MIFRTLLCGIVCTLATASLASSEDMRHAAPAGTSPKPDILTIAQRPDTAPFSIETGDRVVFLGNAFFERARYYGYVETAFSLCWPEQDVRYRNIGWSGDTVGGLARTSGRRGSRFGTATQGFRRLVDHVELLAPTHLFIAYGFNECFAGEAGLGGFADELDRLVSAIATENREVILLSPLPVEHGFGAPDSEVNARNTMLKAYADVLEKKAFGMNFRYVDLFDALQREKAYFSSDGIHPTEEGYARIPDILVRALDGEPTKIAAPEREKLRAEVVKKNALYFHRWRPRNDAFVYGERKDEQPIAQSEPETIEPFIENQEAIIWNMLSNAGK